MTIIILIKVKVLCQGGTYNYKEAFSYFAKCKMNVPVILDTNWTQNGKYILLCDVVSRIPRDVTHVIETLDLNGKSLCHLII